MARTKPATTPARNPSGLPSPVSIPSPVVPQGFNPSRVQCGTPIPPLKRVQIFSPEEWEEFVQEWAHELKHEYLRVERCGGAGDQGRDVIAYLSARPDGPWDNYQCKHHDKPLSPGVVWIEFAKLCYYTFLREYSVPRYYYFVAPRDVGTALSKLIDKPDALRAQLVLEWPDKCEARITATHRVRLEGDLLAYVAKFDFSIVRKITTLEIIEQHRRSSNHIYRFGGGLPDIPPSMSPPDQIAVREARYVGHLLDAYGDHLGTTATSPADLGERDDLKDHFKRTREYFYEAESLRNFSRETLPPGSFEKLQEEIYHGVIETVNLEHADGYRRVQQTTQQARNLQITDHPLIQGLHGNHRCGVCHQLANDDRLIWVRRG